MLSLTGKRVLIAEDDFFLAEDLRLGLKQLGAVVVGPYNSVSQASDALSDQVDAAVLNVRLKDGSACSLAQSLQGQGVPILLTADPEARPEALPPSPSALVTKPYRMSRLIGLLESALTPA